MLGLLCLGAGAQVPFPQLAEPVATYSFEAEDWHVAPTTTPRSSPYHAKTPTTIPGGRVIRTMELKALLAKDKRVIVIDVLDSKERNTISGAFWLHGAGDGPLGAAAKSRYEAVLEKITSGDKNRSLVFLCLNSECWLSYNAALHALEAGYKDVIWYRGGTDAWRGASQKTMKVQRYAW
jgi:PQQ-dependent catabolism-associated CXXCW motif protein